MLGMTSVVGDMGGLMAGRWDYTLEDRTVNRAGQSSVFSLRSSVFGLQSSVFSLESPVFGLQSSVFGLQS